jgi:3-oxoacyl-[acyl-carrier protein] reductase
MNKTAVITGGIGQIGKASALRLSKLGFKVILIVRRNIEEAEVFLKSLPGNGHQAFTASITDSESLKFVVSKIDQCDVLINAAGITKSVPPKDFEKYTDEMFDEIVINNLRGPFATIREFFPLLKNSTDGLIVNITSASGVRSGSGNLAYGASKAGLDLLTKSLSTVLAPNIRIISICPGFLETATSGAIKPSGFNEQVSKGIPLGRVGSGDDVAATIEALITHIRYSTGSTIILDGGRLA